MLPQFWTLIVIQFLYWVTFQCAVVMKFSASCSLAFTPYLFSLFCSLGRSLSYCCVDTAAVL
ncbi:hypothetical protein EDF70_11386 [Neorhizobium sp. JUb45]|nr:hypothetical protein EDF70_11386 [Neorhizobium sp. JUb45]